MKETCVFCVTASQDHPPLSSADIPAGWQLRFGEESALQQDLARVDVLLEWQADPAKLANVLTQPHKIQWIHVANTGVDHLAQLLDALSPQVAVTNGKGVLDQGIAEFVLGGVLALAKRFPETIRLQQQHKWIHRESTQVRGQRALILGPGSIGTRIGELLAAVGVSVDAAARTERAAHPPFQHMHLLTQLDEVVGEYDYVVAALPLNTDTKGLVRARVFAAMKPTAVFINIGRGKVVDEPALVQALQQEIIRGAVLDVFAVEPLPLDSPLWDMPQVLLSPHMSGDSVGWQRAFIEGFLANADAYDQGKPLLTLVRRD